MSLFALLGKCKSTKLFLKLKFLTFYTLFGILLCLGLCRFYLLHFCNIQIISLIAARVLAKKGFCVIRSGVRILQTGFILFILFIILHYRYLLKSLSQFLICIFPFRLILVAPLVFCLIFAHL